MNQAIVPSGAHSLELAGRVANGYAARRKWEEYMQSKSKNALRNQLSDLRTLVEFFAQTGAHSIPTAEELREDAEAWRHITHGLVAAFKEWLLVQGYAVNSINRKLATVKTYARLAGFDAAIDDVKGIGYKAGRKIDEKRVEAGTPTRIGAKKARKAVMLTYNQAKELKVHPDTPQGRRDALLMCLLLDHGLRCGEVALLKVTNFDLAKGLMTFYRPKVDKIQTHELTADTMRAALAYTSAGDAPAMGPMLRGSRKNGELAEAGMSERAITARVRNLGKERLGIPNVSAHDCRHYWATRASEQGTHPKALQQAGGWNSIQVPMDYINDAEIANAGVKL